MSKRTYEELRDMLRHELDTLTKKGEVTKETLDYFQKLTSTLTKVEQLMQTSEGGGQSMNYSQNSNGYSQRYYPMMPMSYDGASMDMGNSNGYSMRSDSYGQGSYNQGSYDGSYDGGSYAGGGSYARRGRDGDGDGRYSESDYSNRRGRDSRGRYSRDGYSRHTAKEKMIQKLEDMADTATAREKRAIMDCIEELEGQ